MNHYMLKPDSPEELLQSGVKGMKWGVRKDRGHEGEAAKTKKIAKLDTKFEKNAQSDRTTFAIHNRAAQLTNDHDVSRINNKPQYRNADFTHDSPLRRKYYDEHQQAYIKNLRKAADELGTNASGTKKYTIVANKDGWDVKVDAVKHADGEVSFTVKVVYDPKGHILKIVGPDDTLQHFGVKGMHWGVRKKNPMHSDYSSASQAYDRKNFGKGAVDRINNRMHSGKSIKEARNAEYKFRKNRRRVVSYGVLAVKNRKRIAAGAKFAGKTLALTAGLAAVHIAQKAETNRGRAALSDLMGIPSKGSSINYATKKRGAYNITSI